mmetsp:Transcript_26356/g.78254  ORF Transcript_26356/g.78254 Transcript_26356/m.78254 type:complete len:510 (-) Transcript_26356:202-1731(-)
MVDTTQVLSFPEPIDLDESELEHTALGVDIAQSLSKATSIVRPQPSLRNRDVESAAAVLAGVRHKWQYAATGRAAAAAVLIDLKVEHIAHGGADGIAEVARRHITNNKLEDNFYIVDLGNVQRMFRAWTAALPRVTPFYAVKCHPEPGMLRLLNAMGAGFDCASKNELETVLNMGVDPARIIFAHPCKRASDIRFARAHGVQFTTFDTESELHKVAALNPDFKLVLRIRADDPAARVPLGLKYGAEVSEAPTLLRVAKELGLNVVGVSFHVGSGCSNLSTYSAAIASARAVFDDAIEMGFDMQLLDIGGGFTGRFDACGNVMLSEIAGAINAAVAMHFPAHSGVRVIAEPGRYFAETCATLMTPIYGHRDRLNTDGTIKNKDYWLTDGLYGSFNCILYDAQNPSYNVLRSPLLPELTVEQEVTCFPSTLWGPTCDSADVIYKDHQLPQLRNGDWLQWPNAGAYTVAGACDFNGIEFTTPDKVYVFSDSAVDAEADSDDSADTDEVMARS